MSARTGRIAFVVLCCAAGSLLLAAHAAPAADQAKVSCAAVPAPPANATAAPATPIENGAQVERGASCGHGIRKCSASQVGQPCDPGNPGIICSAQANGSYCCLAVAS